MTSDRHPVGPAPTGAQPPGAAAAAGIARAVAATFGVAPWALRRRGRGTARQACARQAAIYLAHVEFGLNYAAAGRLFGRDRTTAAHACRVIEDRREQPEFDSAMAALERLSRCATASHAAEHRT